MKKIIALVLALVMVAACLTACGGAKGATLKNVQKAGKLLIATSPDFPPFESLEGGEVVGIEIDIMKLICEKLDVDLEIVQMDFDSVLIGIQAAKYDCAMSGITVTPAREKNMLFTAPYYNAAQVIVVAEGSPITGKVDAWVVDNLTAMQMVEEGDGLVILDEKMTEEPYAFAFAMGSEDLVAAINDALAALIADGTVEAIFDSYGEAYMKP